MFLFFACNAARAAVTVTPATGGTNICHNSAANGTLPAYTALGTITVSEGVNTDFATGLDVLVITAPAGWQFNTAVTPTLGYTAGGNVITVVNGGYTTTSLTVDIITIGTGAHDAITITGLQIQPTTQTSAAGYIYASTATNITGITTGSAGTNFGNLSETGPTVFAVSGGGNYCPGAGGADIQLTGSQSGVTYNLYNGGALSSSATGTGAAPFDLGLHAAGTYTVQAVDGTGCTSNMTGSATATALPSPAQFNVTGATSYCAGGPGVDIGLSGSVAGTNYQLYNGLATVGGVFGGTSGTIDFGVHPAGSYSVLATTVPGGCTAPMLNTLFVTANPLPNVYTVGGGGAYCAGGAGVNVTLSNSDIGINYQLYVGASTIGGIVPGTAVAPLVLGMETAPGVYSVSATNPGTGCSAGMSGTTTVSTTPAPTVYELSGGGSYCIGGTGDDLVLNGSQVGASYQLYFDGSALGAPVAGTGASTTNFGFQTAIGTYSVLASIGTCTSNMIGTANVSTVPPPTVFTLDGGGGYCEGGAGIPMILNGSQVGVNYQLYYGAAPVGSPVAGTGAPTLTLGFQTLEGIYSVVATNPTTLCTSNMLGTATVTINPAPTVYTVDGGGGYCAGGTGMDITLSNSDLGVNYQLYKGSAPFGGATAGTHIAPLDFGLQTIAGTYTVSATNATTGCTANMSGSATVIINALPLAYPISVGGTICAGGTGINLTQSGSQAGVSYQLYNGAAATGSPVTGTGSTISFGPQTVAGTYSVLATNIATACTNTMTGTATIVVNAAPNVYAVAGGGSYCAGGAGQDITLSNSDLGVNYQLYRGSSAVGAVVGGTNTPPLDMGFQTVAGIYTVLATNPTTGCTQEMSGSATVSVNLLPAVYTISAGGSYCAGNPGIDLTLDGSQPGVQYQLYYGATATGALISGTGAALDLGIQTSAGTYSVLATNAATTCTNNMAGVADVIVNTPPSAFTISAGGSYCEGGAGVDLTLNGSEIGVDYQVYDGATPVGSPVAGTGTPTLDLGFETLSATYSVVATNTTSHCTTDMLGTATVTMNPLPTVYVVGGGGSYCAGGTGVDITLSNSDLGINYQLYNGASPFGGPIAGTHIAPLDMGIQTIAGTYTVSATNTVTGCSQNMSGSVLVSVNPLPTAFAISAGGSYCAGGAGIDITQAGSQTGVSYQLYNGATATGSPKAGTGGTIDFGAQTAAGTYSVLATNTTTLCTNAMTGTATITINPKPTRYSVGGGGSYCAGGAGVEITLSNSETGINYQLYHEDTAVGAPVAGTAIAPLNMGVETAAGVYTVFATNPVTGCTRKMKDSALVIINPLPTVYTISAGGSYCVGSAGVDLVLNGSDTGISYQLYFGAAPIGSPVAGTGAALDMGFQTGVGTYSVLATNNTTSCTNNMAGTASVASNPVPLVFTISAGGSYCEGGAGVDLQLNGSESGINYQLYYGAAAVGAAVAGTGAATLDLGFQTGQGTYTVLATNPATLCTSNMLGTATITINPLPAVYIVAGGGSYCAGDTGVHVSLSNSDLGINYQLYVGASPIGGPVAGTGSMLDMGLETIAGTYTVSATNATTGCTQNMFGSAMVSVNPLPAVFNVTGGGSYCQGGTGVDVGLDGSVAGMSYQLYAAGSPVGSPLPGTGAALDFGLQTMAGAYSVIAQDTTTHCVNNMNSTITVATNPLPTVYTLSSGGSYCTDGPGIDLTLSGADTGISYQLYYNGAPLGTPVAGTGVPPLDLGFQTGAGNYNVIGTNTVTGCVNFMMDTAVIGILPLPNVYDVTGGGGYCMGDTGVHVTLDGSDTGVNYQLFNDGLPVGGLVAGTGVAPLDMGLETLAGDYTVFAINATTGCANNMSGDVTVSINPLPGTFNITGGGEACYGAPGVDVGLDGSAPGISYQLYIGGVPIGAALAGTGSALDFGLQINTGVYTVYGEDTTTHCTSLMNGIQFVIINPLPTVYNVTGGGAYCSGGTGADVGLDNSSTGVNYQLYYGGSPIGLPIAGTGSAIDFGLQTGAGVYSVLATDTTTATLCTNNMAGSATVSINPLPTGFNVTGGGGYCIGGTGLDVAIDGSETGVLYTLFYNGFPVGTAQDGTGSGLDFGIQSAAGSYYVMAGNLTTGCFGPMNDTVTIVINPLPIAYDVTGGGTMCAGAAGFDIQLSNSETGVNYQLYINTLPYGAPLAGTSGSVVDFGTLAFAGSYYVVATNATTGCIALMNDSATVVVNPTPGAITGDSVICSGTSAMLADTSAGGTWSSNDGTIATIDATGNMAGIAGGVTTISYTFATGCGTTLSVTINQAPNEYTVTGGGSLCAGGTGYDIALSGSDGGATYQLYINTLPFGTPVLGTGAPIDFGVFNIPGSYYVVASNASESCNALMIDSALIILNPSPGPINGLTTICAGTSTTLTDTAAGGMWSSNDISIASIDTTGLMTGIGSGNTFITYTLPSTCYVTASVTVNALPVVAAITGTTNECLGAVSTLADATGGGVWSTTDATIAPVDPLGNVTGLTVGVVTIAYAVTDVNGCIGAATTPDTVNAMPVVDAITGAMSVCVNGTVTLLDDSTGGVWNSGDVTIATIDPATGKVTGIAAGTANITYTLTGAGGCTASATNVETVNPLPDVDPIIGLNSVCAGFTIVLTDASAGGSWSSSDATVATVDATGIVTGVGLGGSAIYYTVTNGFGCMNTAFDNVTVGAAITGVSVLPGGNVTLCGGSPINLIVTTADTTLTYQWSMNGVDIAGATNGSYITDTTGLFDVTINNGTCSETITGTTVIAPPHPIVNYNSTGNYLYTGSYATYQWYRNGSLIAGATSSILNAPTPGVYKVVVSDANGCFVNSANYTVPGGGGGGTGVENATGDISIRVYPNPATSVLTIEAPVVVNVTVMSPDGKVVLAQKQATSINVSNLADGLYMIMIYDESNSLLRAEKFVKVNN